MAETERRRRRVRHTGTGTTGGSGSADVGTGRPGEADDAGGHSPGGPGEPGGYSGGSGGHSSGGGPGGAGPGGGPGGHSGPGGAGGRSGGPGSGGDEAAGAAPKPPPARPTPPGRRMPGPPVAGQAAETAPVHDPEPVSVMPAVDDREAERGLRGLVGAGSSQVSAAAAMRARDASRPTEAELAAAERDLVIIRRGWVPRDPLTR